MIYRDLLKISIYFVAVKLFIDFSSQLPERIYNLIYSKTGNISVNILLYTLINFFFVVLLINRGGFFVELFFKEKEEFIKEDFKSTSALKIALIVCAYYVILNSLFSLIMTLPNFQFNFYVAGVFMSIVISLLILFFSDKISEKFKV